MSQWGGAIEPITSTVSAFVGTIIQGGSDVLTFTTELGGGNGTYSATTTIGQVSVNGTTLTLYTGSGNGTVTVTSGTETLEIPVSIEYQVCLTGDTLITMWDKTQKPIKDIRNGEYVLSLNEKGEEVPGYVYYADGELNKLGKHYDKFTFSDGTVIKVIHRHRFYNNYDKAFTHLDNFYVGDKCYKQDGTWVTLVEKVSRAEEGDIPHYTIFCNHNTYFANGLLCGNRFSDKVILQDPSIPTEETWSWQPIVRAMPSSFKADKIWINSENKDIYLEYNGEEVNYFQTDNNEAKLFLYKYNGDKNYYDITLEELDTNGEKVFEILEYDTKFDISNLDWNYMLFYEYKIDRTSPVAVMSFQSANGGGDTCANTIRLTQLENSEEVVAVQDSLTNQVGGITVTGHRTLISRGVVDNSDTLATQCSNSLLRSLPFSPAPPSYTITFKQGATPYTYSTSFAKIYYAASFGNTDFNWTLLESDNSGEEKVLKTVDECFYVIFKIEYINNATNNGVKNETDSTDVLDRQGNKLFATSSNTSSNPIISELVEVHKDTTFLIYANNEIS